jgi:hypothetical protein
LAGSRATSRVITAYWGLVRCVIGHHEASKHARQQATQKKGSGSSATSKYGQSEPAR